MAEVADTAYDVLGTLDGSESLEVITFATLDFSAREIGVGASKLAAEGGGGSEALVWADVSGGVGFSGTWVDFGDPYYPAAYAKDASFGYLSGLVKDGIAAEIFVLPVGFRPAEQVIYYFRSQGGGGLEITAAGVVQNFGTLGLALNFDGVQYRLA